jgi:hypothetical protein
MEILAIDARARGHKRSLQIAGTTCVVETNCPQLGYGLCDWELPVLETADVGGFSMQILVIDGDETPDHPHFRGLHHLVIASFGHANVFVFDLLRRHIAACVSERVSRDPQFWNQLLLPIAVGVIGPTVGVVPIHCACLSLNGEGLLVAGASGAGKSTLTAALVQSGFEYVSDDWTYLSELDYRLVAHGMSACIKLLPDAVLYFPQLAEHLLTKSLGGELAYVVESDFFGSRAIRSCVPRCCIFLERNSRSERTFAPLCPGEVRHRFQSSVEPLPSQLSDTASTRADIIKSVADLPSWTFCCGGTPQFAAREILSFVSRQKQEVWA